MEQSLLALAVLACPVGMGLMMWLMMRGKKGPAPPQEGASPSRADAEIASLRAELDQLRAETRDRQTPPSNRT
ncbi:hypothetical protein [Kribbella catacumbae]|uniref:hypothetical protein n=1 Tax=Kribbella catacumbae TaxID=460086 RepID=UPI00035EE456|nr:hypothetical protein [Kribbella catacumbae]